MEKANRLPKVAVDFMMLIIEFANKYAITQCQSIVQYGLGPTAFIPTILRCYIILMPFGSHDDFMISAFVQHGFVLVSGDPSKWIDVSSFVFGDLLIGSPMLDSAALHLSRCMIAFQRQNEVRLELLSHLRLQASFSDTKSTAQHHCLPYWFTI